MQLLDITLPRTLDTLVSRFGTDSYKGYQVEAWLFDSEAARRTAEARLAQCGIRARFRSAYKPLIHHFLEEAPRYCAPLTIALPCHEAAGAKRFRLEAYPLAGMSTNVISFTEGSDPLAYAITSDDSPPARVFAPNILRPNPRGVATLTPCGWLRIHDTEGTCIVNEALETDYEALFRIIMETVSAHPWPARPPFFDILAINATIPGIERPLPYGDEVISTAEAMHEDLYFSINELLKQRVGLPDGDRTLQPGQIVPDIAVTEGDARLVVSLQPHSISRPVLHGPETLEGADRPLSPDQIKARTDILGGDLHDIVSVQGRPVIARVLAGQGIPLLLSAGQHANETSGPIGALRAAEALRLAHQPFALIPCENPDGYALHHELRARNPRHMHHAARYSALGDDVEARMTAPFHEKAARIDVIAATGARLHLNLHGYPAHEWTRPLTGYLPAGFDLWTIPKGFFLIFRHHPGRADVAVPFLEALTARLAADAELARFNARQLATWAAHAGEVPFPVINGIPCQITETERQATPYQIITEYPDETIYGDAFRLAHTTQMRSALFAADLLQAGMLP